MAEVEEDEEQEGWDVFREDGLHVQGAMCSTCIFRPGNLMNLEPGRVQGMVDETLEVQGCIPCHKTIHGQQEHAAVCKGFWDRYKRHVFGLRLAVAMNCVTFDQVEEGESDE